MLFKGRKMIILNAVSTQSISFTIVVTIGFLFFAILLYLMIFKPKHRDKILDAGDTPFNYLGEGGDGIFLIMVPVLFMIFCCLLLFVLYGWIQPAIQ